MILPTVSYSQNSTNSHHFITTIIALDRTALLSSNSCCLKGGSEAIIFERKMGMAVTGVIHGRFQVLHNDHLKYLLAGKKRCSHLVVGITNPDPTLTRDDPADPHRSLPSSNPLTYYERYILIQAALIEAGLEVLEFSVVPFPINLPELYRHYVPLDAIFFLTIYDAWGERKLKHFESLGLKTEVLWRKNPDEKGLSGAFIRKKMASGESWEHMVPPSTARLMKHWDLPGRLRNIDRTAT